MSTTETTQTVETLPSPKKMLGIASRFAAFDHALKIEEVADNCYSACRVVQSCFLPIKSYWRGEGYRDVVWHLSRHQSVYHLCDVADDRPRQVLSIEYQTTASKAVTRLDYSDRCRPTSHEHIAGPRKIIKSIQRRPEMLVKTNRPHTHEVEINDAAFVSQISLVIWWIDHKWCGKILGVS